MNIHPLFVHFPIALLAVYALLEIITPFVNKKAYKTYVEHAKTWFVSIGIVSTVPTIITGGLAGELVGETKLIEAHESFAIATTVVFALLASGYILRVCDACGVSTWLTRVHTLIARALTIVRRISAVFMYPPVRITLAVVGLALITITGGLGASIVYGPGIDPIVTFIYTLIIGGGA